MAAETFSMFKRFRLADAFHKSVAVYVFDKQVNAVNSLIIIRILSPNILFPRIRLKINTWHII
jgi:hypothetical protein